MISNSCYNPVLVTKLSPNNIKSNFRVEKYDYDLFKGVSNNDVKKVREMIDCGVDINMKEYEKGTCPIHIASSRGHKQVLELLVSRGCDINVQDDRGWTPLHSLVTGRYDILALWLIRQGANINLKDNNGFTALDRAQSWFQKEMIDVAEGRISNSEATLLEVRKEQDQKKEEYQHAIKSILQHHHEESKNSSNQYFISQQPNAANKLVQLQSSPYVESPIKGLTGSGSEVIKIYFRNDSYKSVKVTASDNCQSIIKVMCEKFNMKSFDKCFDLCEVIKGNARFLSPNDLLLESKLKNWPIILTNNGYETNNHCHFSIVIKKTAPKEAIKLFESIL
ncbi:hypothetical protein ACTA71_006831 [Dictyostelium dimigraforme]